MGYLDAPCQRDQVGHNLKKLGAPAYIFPILRVPVNMLIHLKMTYARHGSVNRHPKVPEGKSMKLWQGKPSFPIVAIRVIDEIEIFHPGEPENGVTITYYGESAENIYEMFRREKGADP